MILLNKKRDKKTSKLKKKTEILDRYKNEIQKDLNIEDKPIYNLVKEKKILNKEKANQKGEKSIKFSKVFEK